MRIVVVDTLVPFVRTPADAFSEALVGRLSDRGHDVELVRIPFRAEPLDRIPREIAIAEELLLDRTDRVIALRFPASLLTHPDTTLWLSGLFDPQYDESSDADRRAREAAAAAKARAFRRAHRVFASSPAARAAIEGAHGVAAELLLPPQDDAGWTMTTDRLLA